MLQSDTNIMVNQVLYSSDQRPEKFFLPNILKFSISFAGGSTGLVSKYFSLSFHIINFKKKNHGHRSPGFF
jgi:hypothetical protein